MLTATRRAATSKIEYFIAIFEMVFLFSGAAASMLFGKLLLALVFFAIALGVFLRLTSRRNRQPVPAQRMPMYLIGLAGAITLIEVLLFLRIADLRLIPFQPSFSYSMAGLAVLIAIAAYFLQLFALRRLQAITVNYHPRVSTPDDGKAARSR